MDYICKTFLVSDMHLLFGVFILNTEWTSQIWISNLSSALCDLTPMQKWRM